MLALKNSSIPFLPDIPSRVRHQGCLDSSCILFPEPCQFTVPPFLHVTVRLGHCNQVAPPSSNPDPNLPARMCIVAVDTDAQLFPSFDHTESKQGCKASSSFHSPCLPLGFYQRDQFQMPDELHHPLQSQHAAGEDDAALPSYCVEQHSARGMKSKSNNLTAHRQQQGPHGRDAVGPSRPAAA